jgi:hypothetical protein
VDLLEHEVLVARHITSALQSTSKASRPTGSPESVRISAEEPVRTTISPFSTKRNLLVLPSKAGTALARKVSPSPNPTTRGL